MYVRVGSYVRMPSDAGTVSRPSVCTRGDASVCLFISRVPITLLRSDFGKEFERIVDRQQDRRCKDFKLRNS
jgi:hypothetical protein